MSYDVLVIGGGPAGMSAALNVRARGGRVLVVSNPLEENPLWRSKLVDNHLGMPGLSGKEMLTQFRRHAEAAGAEFREGKVLSTVQAGDDWYVSIGSDMEHAKALVLAAGVARGGKFPGEEALLGRGVSYCATCDGMLYRGKPVAVLGYSDTARREAEYLTGIGCFVTYFDRPRTCSIAGGNQVTERQSQWRACSSCGPPWPQRTCSPAWRWRGTTWRWTGPWPRTCRASSRRGTAPAAPCRSPRPWERA